MPIARDHYTAKWCLVYLVQRIGSQVGGRHPIQSPRPLVLVQKCPGLPGRQLSARRRRPNQTTAFCIHSNTRQSDAQQLWRQDLCRRRTTSLEQSAAQSQDYVGCHTASSGGYWRHLYSDSEATAQCELFLTAPNRNILTYLHTITVMLAG